METCPDCTAVKAQVKDDSRFEVIDIGKHVRNLKDFLRLRDKNAAFDVMKRVGAVGIPCFVLEDGTVTFKPEKAGVTMERQENDGATCNIDGSGC